jgi:hypothetical protein
MWVMDAIDKQNRLIRLFALVIEQKEHLIFVIILKNCKYCVDSVIAVMYISVMVEVLIYLEMKVPSDIEVFFQGC